MIPAILILAVLITLNGVLAMSELAMMTSRGARLQQAAQRGSKGAAAALRLAREPTRFLSTVQVGITLIGILAGAFGENAIARDVRDKLAGVPWLAPYADTLAFLVVVLGLTYFSLVLGELVPKRLALAFPERIAMTIARPLTVVSMITAAPVRILTWSTRMVLRAMRVKVSTRDDVSEDDVRSLVARAASTGVFTPQEHVLFQRAMRVGDLTVWDLMVPRTQVVWIDENAPIDGVRVLVGTSPHSHFPVCAGDLDKLLGVVHLKDLITYGLLEGSDFKVTAVAQKPVFVPPSMPALKLLDLFRSAKMHIAFVVDEYGVIKGLLTLNDVVGAILGDFQRKGDDPIPVAKRRTDGTWLLDGRLLLHEMVVELGISADAEAELPDVSTVAGLVTSILGHIPVEGEYADWKNWRLEVIDMDGKRVDKVLGIPIQDAAKSGGGGE